jgi:uncharacterized PurR-regulated membrane protein YhhQ (DUF165 family)
LKAAVAVVVYIAAIVAANVLTQRFGLVPVGFGLVATAGTYAAGFALLARDFVHRYAGVWWVLGGIVIGIALSWWLASPALALASAAAFGIAELADLGVFVLARPRGFITAAATSNVVSAPLDTVVFLAIAGFPLTWDVIAGQLVCKLLWATAVPLAVYWVVSRAVLRQSEHGQDPRGDAGGSARVHHPARPAEPAA